MNAAEPNFFLLLLLGAAIAYGLAPSHIYLFLGCDALCIGGSGAAAANSFISAISRDIWRKAHFASYRFCFDNDNWWDSGILAEPNAVANTDRTRDCSL
jgi:hypothetical protein